MKQLILFRHAEAAEKFNNQPDKERQLTTVGKTNAAQIGAYLYREKFLPNVIISSDAKRAKQTAQIISSQLAFDANGILYDSLLYEVSSPRIFLQQVNTIPDRFETVMLVGHNPIFTSMAEYFTSDSKGALPPAAAMIIRFEVDSWKEVSEGNGTIEEYIYPAIL
jgi:phosphohistidine phosphatase